jgi:hypothetical protein
MTAQLDWYGCATFRLTVGSLVIFLDAYIDRIPEAAGTGLRADDIERADWIVVGHSHFDHLWGAERIAKRTGATVIGSHETVRFMEQEGVPLSQLLPVSGGERIRLSSEVAVAVYPSLHSCVWTPKGGMYQPDEVCLGDLGVTYQERMARLQEVMQGLAGLGPEVMEHLQVSAEAGTRRWRQLRVFVRDARRLAAVSGYERTLERHPAQPAPRCGHPGCRWSRHHRWRTHSGHTCPVRGAAGRSAAATPRDSGSS